MRIWIRFSKEAPLRYLSHLDLLRAWQRAIRRTGIPMAYSAGFNPHPKMSFASALAVGVTSEAEYLDIVFARDLDKEDVARLSSMLPSGMRILATREVPSETPPLMALVAAASYTVPVGREHADTLQKNIHSLLQAVSLPVEREGKKGIRTIDVRPYLYRLQMLEEDGPLLWLLLGSGSEGGARPGEILALLGIKEEEITLHRTGLFVAAGSCLQSPMEILLNKKEVSPNAEKDRYQL